MKGFSQLGLLLCYLSVSVTVLSLFLPQKRTRKIFGFVIGLFVICTMLGCVRNTAIGLSDETAYLSGISVPQEDDTSYRDTVIQTTAENLVSAVDEILRSEGIEVRDIRLSLKISDAGRIYVGHIDIYISESDLPRKREIESIVYRNLSKEPAVYVEKEEVE